MRISQDVHITFFDIKRCGYYKHADPVPQFGSVDDTLSQLEQWSANLELSRTRLFDPDIKRDDDPVYLFGLKKNNDSWLVATWNEVPHGEAGVASVSMDSKVGEAQVHLNEFVENTIPGYATYFWIIPGKNLLATIKFGNKSGQPGLVAYLGRFLGRYSRYAIIGQRDGVDTVTGYTNRDDDAPMPVRPYFKTSVFQKPNRAQFILSNADKVKRVLRRGRLTTASVLQTTIWQNMVRFLHGQPNNPNVKEQRVYLELDYRPSRQELAQMIEAEEADPELHGFDDIGFVFDGDSQKHWLSGARGSGEINLTVEQINEAVVDIESLLHALHEKKTDILQFLE